MPSKPAQKTPSRKPHRRTTGRKPSAAQLRAQAATTAEWTKLACDRLNKALGIAQGSQRPTLGAVLAKIEALATARDLQTRGTVDWCRRLLVAIGWSEAEADLVLGPNPNLDVVLLLIVEGIAAGGKLEAPSGDVPTFDGTPAALEKATAALVEEQPTRSFIGSEAATERFLAASRRATLGAAAERTRDSLAQDDATPPDGMHRGPCEDVDGSGACFGCGRWLSNDGKEAPPEPTEPTEPALTTSYDERG